MKNILIAILLLLSSIGFSQSSTSSGNRTGGTTLAPGNQTFFITNLSDTTTLAGVRGKDALYVSATAKFYKRTSYWALQATIATSGGTVTNVRGTANQITSTGTADITISLPTDITVNGNIRSLTAYIPALSNLTSNGLVKTTGGTGALSIATPTTDYTIPADLSVYLTTATAANTYMPLTGAAFTTTTGIGHELTSSTLTSGSLFKLTGASTANLTGAKMFEISSTGAHAGSSVTKYGVYSSVTNTGTTSTNVAGYFAASGATNNYPIQAIGGLGASGIILGGYSASYGGVWSSNTVPTGSNFLIIGDGSSTYVGAASNLYLATAGASARITITASNFVSAVNGIINSTVTTGTGSSSGFQVTANSLTTGNGIDASTSSLTTGMLSQFTSTSTALSGTTPCAIKVMVSGANANTAVTATGINVAVTNTNATSGTNIAATLSATGATTNNIALNITGGRQLIAVAPVASVNFGTLSIGSGAFDGSTSGKFVGASSSGTSLAVNEISGYVGNLMELEIAGVSKFRVQNTGVVVISSYLTTPGGSGLNFQSRGWLQSPSDGVFTFQDNAQTSFSRLQLGGTSSSFPAIKRSSATLAFRLADDSADCDISAAKITASAPVVLKGYTVATLPTPTVGMLCYVTDLLAPTFGATAVGGGAVVGLTFYDGTNWTCR